MISSGLPMTPSRLNSWKLNTRNSKAFLSSMDAATGLELILAPLKKGKRFTLLMNNTLKFVDMKLLTCGQVTTTSPSQSTQTPQ